MGLWLIAARKLQCFSRRLKKLSAQDQAPYTALKSFASVPLLLQPCIFNWYEVAHLLRIRLNEARG